MSTGSGRIRRAVLAAAVLVATAAPAATPPSQSDPSADYRDASCEQLFAEIAVIQLRLSELGGRLDVVRPGDAAPVPVSPVSPGSAAPAAPADSDARGASTAPAASSVPSPATAPVRLVLHRPALPPPGAHRDVEGEYRRLAGSLEAVLQALAERGCATTPSEPTRDTGPVLPAETPAGRASARASGADDLPESPVEVGAMRIPGRLVEPKLVIGTRTVDLPPGQWVVMVRRTVTLRYRLAPTMPAPSGTTVDAWQVVALRLDGPAVTGAVTLTAPKSPAGSLPSLWDADPCLSGRLVHREEMSPDPGRPDCVSLRRVQAGDDALERSAYAEAIRIARELGLVVDGPFWEARSARYVIQGFIDIGRLTPAANLPTPERAVQWARALRTSTAALAERTGGVAKLPPP